MQLAGCTAIVTGGAVRVGAAIAAALSDAGVHVGVHCRSHASEASDLVEQWKSQGRCATVVVADLARPEEAARHVVAHCARELGPIDFLVNCASMFESGSLDETGESGWLRTLSVNLVAPALLCRELAASRKDGARQHIVNILDARAARSAFGGVAYAVSKSALASLTTQLAKELAPRVQVNGVAPGAVMPSEKTADDQARRAQSTIPLQRTGTAFDVAEAVLYLLRSDFVTGQILNVAGGEDL